MIKKTKFKNYDLNFVTKLDRFNKLVYASRNSKIQISSQNRHNRHFWLHLQTYTAAINWHYNITFKSKAIACA